MSEPQPPPRQPLNSLATKIIFVVFLSTSLTAVVVSWISVHSTYTFLERRIQASYPAILERTAERLTGWLREAEAELAEPASSLGEPDPVRLARWLERSARFEGALVSDRAGHVLAHAGEVRWPETLPREGLTARGELWLLHGGEGPARLVLSQPVRGAGEGAGLLVHGALRREALATLLASDGLGSSGHIALVGPGDRVLLSSSPAAAGEVPARSLDALRAGGVVEYAGRGGRHMIGALHVLTGSPLQLLLEEPFEKAFEPVFAVVTRVFVIDLCIILAFSFLAYQVTAAIVQPDRGALRGRAAHLPGRLRGGAGRDPRARRDRPAHPRLQRDDPQAARPPRGDRGGEPEAAGAERSAAAGERGARAALDHRRPHQAPQPPLLPGPPDARDQARRAAPASRSRC